MMAKSDLVEAILRKHISQPCAASSSGWMWVSVKKTKSKEPGWGWSTTGNRTGIGNRTGNRVGNGGRAAAAPVAARVLRKFLRSNCIFIPETVLGTWNVSTATECWKVDDEEGFVVATRALWWLGGDGCPRCGCVLAARRRRLLGLESGAAPGIVAEDGGATGASRRALCDSGPAR